ncbi:unnamed protein product [Staurois parvus]|uniref:Uncharacterized protein n=1 Tax=Staurois parvus TaxID=386267 RepID=A0ABN9G3U9_9NEOB|nr:unnamed protein product [Staurois parvus]
MTRDCGHSTGDDQRLQTFWEWRGGSRYLNLTGTRSHFRGVVLPPHLLRHVTGPRRLPDHSQSAAHLAHAQWAPGCEAATCHSRVPTLKMPGLGREDGEDTAGLRNR